MLQQFIRWDPFDRMDSFDRMLSVRSNGPLHQSSSVSLCEFALLIPFTSDQITIPFLLPEMVERVASMLNYFLLQIVGPQRKSLSLKDPGKYEFRPKLLLKQIVNIYVNLARGDTKHIFPAAIIRDGCSYNEQLFDAAADVLRRIGEDARFIHDFVELGKKAKIAASEAMDAEATLGDILHEFLEPIQVHKHARDLKNGNTSENASLREGNEHQMHPRSPNDCEGRILYVHKHARDLKNGNTSENASLREGNEHQMHPRSPNDCEGR
ncbi:hypothetical protein CASFOL_041400 [Castilleja foliolosa]|uniref:Ubiquitin conjugation factor E4 core domain-containing protein n=1 Tax=Castilleja foliolosa TaxID=1961234 RepID=A0ABD3BBQ5_9LAMI